ncbi:MAG: autotransporter-associated beta strand repeat-containing protein, partial [Chthoniobacteraceae bacterium]
MKNPSSPQCISSDMRLILCSALSALVILLPGATANAASATWNASPTDGNWVTDGSENNWGTGVGTSPGATSGTTNTDTATFNNASATTAITINSPTLNVDNITFDTATGSYTLSGGGLLLTAGGTIQLSGTVTSTGKTETIGTPITLEGNYTFANNSTTSDVLNFGTAGTITSGGTTGATTLTLAGANTGSNIINSVISNGSGSNLVGVTKSGAGTWILAGANTFGGPLTISTGVLQLANASASGTGTVTVNANNGLAFGQGIGTFTLGALAGTGSLVLADTGGNAVTLQVGGNNASTTYSGVISGPGGLTMNGLGTLILSNTADNIFGGLTINSGTVEASGAGQSYGPLFVAAGAT